MGYIYRLLWRSERSLAFTGIFTVPISLALAALAIYTPPAVLSVLGASDKFSPVALVIAGLLLAQMLCDIANNIFSAKINSSEQYVLMQMEYIWLKYLRDRAWYHDYDPEVQKLNERADNAVRDNHAAGVHFPMDFSNMLTQIFSFLLFGAVVSLLHPIIILLLAAGSALNAAMGKWERRKNWEERDVRNDLEKKMNCITWSIAPDFSYAKDIRLYGMKQFLHDRVAHLIDLNMAQQRKIRVLYKDAPFVVLDEPTAALDPIAEAAVYENFNVLVENKTAVFISHRLSSCRFCDSIAVFDHGQLIQQGSHDALVTDVGGKYSQLWHAQPSIMKNRNNFRYRFGYDIMTLLRNRKRPMAIHIVIARPIMI